MHRAAGDDRVLYLLEGSLTVDGRSVGVDAAWHGTGACALVAGASGATLLRDELVRKDVRTHRSRMTSRSIPRAPI